MFFRQFYLESLGHASYFIGSEDTGEALVLDARRDVDVYFAEAHRQSMRIRYAADTHQHNDYVTGICELPPRSWPRMRKMNRGGPPRLGVLPEPPPLGVDELEKMRRTDAVVVDCRTPEAFSAHIPGAFNVGLGPYFATWAGTVLPYDAPLILVLERTEDLWDACWQLLRIGYELPKGWLAGGMLAWRTAGMPIDVLAQWMVWDLRRRLASERDLLVLDVRQPAEWAEGHILGAVHITGAEITQRADEIPRERPVAAICGSGYRSSVAASVLQRRGHGKVFNVLGGMTGWKAEDLPVTE